jgi:hypothetical protein
MARKQIKCSECIHFRTQPVKNGSKEIQTICTLFKFKCNSTVYHADNIYCRDLEMLCGPYAKYFETKIHLKK